MKKLFLLIAVFFVIAGCVNVTLEKSESPIEVSDHLCTSSDNVTCNDDVIEDAIAIPENISKEDSGDSQRYENNEFKFFLDYPSNYVLKDSVRYSFLTDSIISVDLPEELYEGTNLSEAKLILGASQAEKVVTKCLQADLAEEAAGQIEINNIKYSVFNQMDVAAGNYYEMTLYRAIKNETCYEAVVYLHYGNIMNYDESLGIQEFDSERITSQINTVLDGLFVR